MIRREMLKTSAAALIGAPALPSVAGGFPRLGTVPLHTEPEIRKALTEYIDAYRAWRLLPYDDYRSVRPVREIWWATMARLRAMVLDNHGISHEKIDCEGYVSPMGLASRMIDLGDVLVIAAVDPTSDQITSQLTNVVLVPRSQEMFKLLDELPKEDAEEQQIDDEDDSAVESEQDARPSADDVKAAILEAWEADQRVIDEEEEEFHDESDNVMAALLSEQTERWEQVRELALRYRGLPEDYDEDVALKIGGLGDYIVVLRGSEYDYEEPDFSMLRARCEVWDFKRA